MRTLLIAALLCVTAAAPLGARPPTGGTPANPAVDVGPIRPAALPAAGVALTWFGAAVVGGVIDYGVEKALDKIFVGSDAPSDVFLRVVATRTTFDLLLYRNTFNEVFDRTVKLGGTATGILLRPNEAPLPGTAFWEWSVQIDERPSQGAFSPPDEIHMLASLTHVINGHDGLGEEALGRLLSADFTIKSSDATLGPTGMRTIRSVADTKHHPPVRLDHRDGLTATLDGEQQADEAYDFIAYRASMVGLHAPEPATITLVALGGAVLGLGALRTRRRRTTRI